MRFNPRVAKARTKSTIHEETLTTFAFLAITEPSAVAPDPTFNASVSFIARD
jgi:hypothetical protein